MLTPVSRALDKAQELPGITRAVGRASLDGDINNPSVTECEGQARYQALLLRVHYGWRYCASHGGQVRAECQVPAWYTCNPWLVTTTRCSN